MDKFENPQNNPLKSLMVKRYSNKPVKCHSDKQLSSIELYDSVLRALRFLNVYKDPNHLFVSFK